MHQAVLELIAVVERLVSDAMYLATLIDIKLRYIFRYTAKEDLTYENERNEKNVRAYRGVTVTATIHTTVVQLLASSYVVVVQ